MIHAVTLFLALPLLNFGPVPHVTAYTPAETIASAEISYLPPVGGGSPGEKAGSHGSEGLRAAVAPSRNRGQTVKGPQHILSTPPNPDNNLQTILQPDRKDLPRIKVPLQIPSSIHVAKKHDEIQAPDLRLRESVKNVSLPTAVAKPVLRAKADVVAAQLDSQLASPKLPVPVLSDQIEETPARAEPIVVAREKAGATRVASAPVITGVNGTDQQSLAVINAIQINAQPQLAPRGEKAGLFEVSPEGTGTVPGKAPGSTSSSDDTLTASGRTGGAGKGTAGNAAPGAKGDGERGDGPGTGIAGSGNGSGERGTGGGKIGSGGNGKQGGVGNGEGGNGRGRGPGSGAGTGSGAGPFAGISVAGPPRQSSIVLPTPNIKPSRVSSYDLTVVGSAGSGGLKDFGVFKNEAVYTVYVDVSDAGGGSSTWTLQYAVLPDPRSRRQTSITLDTPGPAEAMLEPPFPMQKTIPEPAATGFAHNGTVVVTAVLSREGKLESIRTLQSPNKDRTDSVIAALGQWVFRPGKRGGEALPLKVVLGIPVSW